MFQGCYGDANVIANATNSFELDLATAVGSAGATIDRAVIQEGMSNGQIIAGCVQM